MSKPDCNACADLREFAPDFVVNGVTEAICESLQRNLGFNPNLVVPHSNCDDLHAANDCLVGRQVNELPAYDVCDWKQFMERFLPGLYEVIKGIICGDCGQWNRIYDLCTLLQQQMTGNLSPYGDLVGEKLKDMTDHWGGEIVSKNGIPAIRWRFSGTTPEPGSYDYDSLGVEYRKITVSDCDGNPRTYEWIRPHIHCYYFASNIDYGDVFWRVDLNTARGWGLTETMINWLHDYPQFVPGYSSSYGRVQSEVIEIDVKDGYLRLIMRGSTGTPQNAYVDAQTAPPLLAVS